MSSRRRFLQQLLWWGGGSLALGSLGYRFWNRKNDNNITGRIVGANARMGHLLRDGHQLPAPSETKQVPVVIIGGGVAGLSAAWWLQRQGYTDYLVLELEQQLGGNSASGKNEVSAYPWGAHYLPVPAPDAPYVVPLLEELGVITGRDEKGIPIYNEYHLVHDPEDRLYRNGRWQEGIIPNKGLHPNDTAQIARFLQDMEQMRVAQGQDGRKAFALPVALSSTDPRYRALDTRTMKEYLLQQGYTSEYLHWYVDYCCRDDYGTRYEDTSAWAGIHYFAGRYGYGANADSQAVLTWPQGNGWLVEQMAARLKGQLHTQAMVTRLQNTAQGAEMVYYDLAKGISVCVQAQQVVWAAPHFVATRVVQGLAGRVADEQFTYAPWLVANITLRETPGGLGAPLSWDNVSYHSRSLGYIVATHQGLASHSGPTVITYYYPLSDGPPREQRQQALARSYAQWQQWILNDLEATHPGITGQVQQLDVWLWGHGMVRPVPGFIWGQARVQAAQPYGHIHFAHADLSGMSIFEEAQYQGVRAAQAVLQALGRPTT